MALVSFTLRRSIPDRGSYVRYDADTQNTAASAGIADGQNWVIDDPAGTRDSDRYLRSDNYQIPPNEFTTSFIQAITNEYGVVSLNWQVPLASEITETPVATESILVYSPAGKPTTINSGTILQQSATNFNHRHTGVPEGKWAYYALFIRYQSTLTGEFYEKVADIEVLVPRNYQSVLELWRRIPLYYRNLDTTHPDAYVVNPNSDLATQTLGALPGGYIVGPLFRFLCIFGYEMDRMRTILDHIMVSKDPAEANSESLTSLNNLMGVPYSSEDLSMERLRALLDDIGFIRRRKGTEVGAELYGRAFSGSDVDIDQDTKCITFYAQRVNHVPDPLNATGLVLARPAHECEVVRPLFDMGTYDPTTYVEGDTATYPSLGGNDEYLEGMYWASEVATTFKNIPVDVGDSILAYTKNGAITFAVCGGRFDADNYAGYNTYSYTPHSATSNTDVTYTYNGSGDADGVTHLMFRLNVPVPVKYLDKVAFSVHSAVGTDALRWVRLTDRYHTVIGWSEGLTKAGDSPAAQAIALQNLSTTDEWTVGVLDVLIDISSVNSYQMKYLLAERNRLGEYFDGSYTRGGWLTDPDGNRTSDFRWVDDGDNLGNFNTGTAFDSISVYSEDYRRTRALLYDNFKRALPVNVADNFEFCSFDAVPGMDAIDDYYDSFWHRRTASDTTATGDSANVDGFVIYTGEATGTSDECATYAVGAANYDDSATTYDSGTYDSSQRSGGYNENGITYNEADSIYRNNGTCFPSAGYNEAEIVYNDPNINYPERGS